MWKSFVSAPMMMKDSDEQKVKFSDRKEEIKANFDFKRVISKMKE